jgi:hypothetical protein
VIADCLNFLRSHLDAQLRKSLGNDPDDASADKLVFLEGDKLDPIAFQLGAVTQLLINVEEERVLRSADPYVRRGDDGSPQRVQPELRLILYVLFVARFRRYDDSWRHLSAIVEHLQAQRVFTQSAPPSPPAQIDTLVLELVTLSMAEQNELWGMLKASQHPAVLYRVKLLALRDRHPISVQEVRAPVDIGLRQVP